MKGNLWKRLSVMLLAAVLLTGVFTVSAEPTEIEGTETIETSAPTETGAPTETEAPAETEAPTVTVQPTATPEVVQEVRVNVGASYTAKPKGLSGKCVWQTEDASVAAVSSAGKITGKTPGSTVVSVQDAVGTVVRYAVTVLRPASKITLKSERTTLNVGEAVALTTEILPEDVSDRTVKFTSGKASVAAVSAEGIVTAVAPGSATITAATANGKKATLKLTIVQPAESVEAAEAATVNVGSQKKLTATVLPTNTTNKKLTWVSSDPSIATVTSAGSVRGKAPGCCVITATAHNGIRCEIALTVIQPVTGVTLTAAKKTVNVGETLTLKSAVKPANASDPTLTFVSSSAAVASVDEEGTVTALKAGSATITAKASNGKKATVKLTVVQPVEAVEINSEALTLNVGSQKKLTAAVLPTDATNQKLTWTTSDKKVATVTSAGAVSGKGPGSCVITATAHNGIRCEVPVTVIQPVTGITLKAPAKTLAVNNTMKLGCTLKPANASDPTVIWSSSDETVATVDENGVVTGLTEGSVTVTAAASNGKTASVTLKVQFVHVSGVRAERCFVTLHTGEQLTLNAAVSPTNATDRTVTFESSAPEVATVDAEGIVTAHSEGRATVTITAADGGAKGTCTLSVIAPGSKRLAGIIIGINPGHQNVGGGPKQPIRPGSKELKGRIGVGTSGCVTRTPEREVNLQVGLKLKKLLEEEGATVVITRTSNDVDLGNIERAQMLNAAGADLALQLHCNSSDSSGAKGISAFTRNWGDFQRESAEAGTALLNAMTAATGAKSAGQHTSGTYMSLNYSETPSVLVEMGYMSNPEEDRKLASDGYQDLLALGLLNGICDYFDR